MVWGEEMDDDDQMSWEISEQYLKTRLRITFAFVLTPMFPLKVNNVSMPLTTVTTGNANAQNMTEAKNAFVSLLNV